MKCFLFCFTEIRVDMSFFLIFIFLFSSVHDNLFYIIDVEFSHLYHICKKLSSWIKQTFQNTQAELKLNVGDSSPDKGSEARRG